MKKILIFITLISVCIPTIYGMQDDLKSSRINCAIGSLATIGGTTCGLLGSAGSAYLYTSWGEWSPARGLNPTIAVFRVFVALFCVYCFLGAFGGLTYGVKKLKAGCCS